jgi:hypothetical protein
MYKILLTLTALLGTAMANIARVHNKCPVAVHLWSVGSTISPPFLLAAKTGTYAETFRRDPVSGGIAIKIMIPPGTLTTPGAPQTIFAYNLDGHTVWYDLSDVFGNAFAGKRMVLASAETACAVIEWPNGVPPGGGHVRSCSSAKDLTLTLCA